MLAEKGSRYPASNRDLPDAEVLAVSPFFALLFLAFFSTAATGSAGSLGGPEGLLAGGLVCCGGRRVAQPHTSPGLRGALQTSQAKRIRPMRQAIAQARGDYTAA